MTSSLYRELTESELARIVRSALGAQVRSAKLLTGGLFNTTYLVDTPECGRTVLRVGPVNRRLLMPFEHHLMEAEAHVYALCAEKGIPVSEVLAMDTSKTQIDRDFMFVRYIPSRPMSAVELSAEERARIAYRVGCETAKMHEIRAGQFGRIVDVAKGNGFARWSECLLSELRDWETVGVPAALFTQAEHANIRRLFEAAVPYLDEITEPRLVHTDLWLGNVLVTDDAEHPEFAAIIDADRALWGDPEFEFSSIWWSLKEERFWEGYGRRLSQTRAARIRVGVYHLLNRLWNAYVYLKEYNQPENAQQEMELAHGQIAELEQLLEG